LTRPSASPERTALHSYCRTSHRNKWKLLRHTKSVAMATDSVFMQERAYTIWVTTPVHPPCWICVQYWSFRALLVISSLNSDTQANSGTQQRHGKCSLRLYPFSMV
jgi:hypothetical protein